MDERVACVVGGGIVGLLFAVLLNRRRANLAAVLERAAGDGKDDGKSVIFRPRAVETLRRADVWRSSPSLPLRRLEIFGGRGFASPICAHWGDAASHRRIHQKLTSDLSDNIVRPAVLSRIHEEKNHVTVEYRQNGDTRRMRCQLAVLACATDELPPPFSVRRRDFHQSALALSARARNWPAECAFEKFSGRGIIALVPRVDKEYPVGAVICAATATAERLCMQSDDELSRWLDDEFGGRFGLQLSPRRFVYAPVRRHVSPLAGGRIALIGGAATTLHPVGAMGLNLGIADAELLADLCGERDGKTTDIFSVTRRYAAARKWAHWAAMASTGTLAQAARANVLPCRMLAAAAMRTAVRLQKTGLFPSHSAPIHAQNTGHARNGGNLV